jgi:undecaprenyl-diphosphatase
MVSIDLKPKGMSAGRKVFIAAVLILLLPFVYFLYEVEKGNFHVITEGEAYRSAQLNRDKLEYYIKKYQIRSILNLRGQNSDASWYKDEIEVSKEQNAMHYDIALSASHELNAEDVQSLLRVFKDAPRPILIHCKGGADRTGLVAAMWKVSVDKEPKSKAGKQLFFLYGHIPIGKTSAMDRFFWNWEPEYR